MIRHVRHAQIDKTEWDRRLLTCANRLWSAQSWVLDLAAPGWEALMDESSGPLMPLTWRRKYGIRYLFQPFGLQQLGAFSPHAITEDHAAAFLGAIPREFRFADICVNEAMPSFASGGWTSRPMRNALLALTADREALSSAYAKGHRRNLKTAKAEVLADVGVREFTDLFVRTIERRYGPFDREGMRTLPVLLGGALERGQGTLTGVRIGNELVAAAFFTNWGGRRTLLRSAADEQGQELRAMFHIVDAYIGSCAATGDVLDFCGSNDPHVMRFNEGFGARPATYFRMRRNTLPFPLNLLKR